MMIKETKDIYYDSRRPSWDGKGPRPVHWTLWAPSSAPTDLPVVLLSHGTGGSAASLSWFANGLAELGYAVLAVDHHGNTAVEDYHPAGFVCWWERMADLKVILSYHLKRGPFIRRLSPKDIHVAGFSLGGYTALGLAGAITDMSLFHKAAAAFPKLGKGPKEFPDVADEVPRLQKTSPVFAASWGRQSQDYTESRIRSVFAMAPAPTVRAFREESLRKIKLPIGILTGKADVEAPYTECSQWIADRAPVATLINAGNNAGHYQFIATDNPEVRSANPDLFEDPPGVRRRDIQARAVHMADRLFSTLNLGEEEKP